MVVVALILTVLFFTLCGMLIMAVVLSQEIEDAYADGYKKRIPFGKGRKGN